jgi:hypothetical protein
MKTGLHVHMKRLNAVMNLQVVAVFHNHPADLLSPVVAFRPLHDPLNVAAAVVVDRYQDQRPLLAVAVKEDQVEVVVANTAEVAEEYNNSI